MSILSEILQYTSAIHFSELEEVVYLPTQLGKHIVPINNATVDLDAIDVILVGCGELRGQDRKMDYSNGPDCVRKEFYKLHYWHEDVRIGDIGNIIEGAQLNDTKAALRTMR